jgi:raffinose/stachyose/melibiose transport system permease protein
METTAQPGTAGKKPKQPFLTFKRQNNLTIFLFMLPAFLLFFVFIIYPMIQSVYYSFFTWSGFGPATDFVGIKNYRDILAEVVNQVHSLLDPSFPKTDVIFGKALINGIIIIVLSLTIQLPLSLALAIMVGRDLPGRVFFRMILFLPYVISEVIAALAWLGLYNAEPKRGLINAILVLLPGVEPQSWLGNESLVLPAIFVVLTWKWFGLHMLLFLAGLQSIPTEVEEAALIDGANRWQLIRYITIPMLANTIRTSVYLSVLGSMQQFVTVWILTKGGPVNASEVMATYMYRYSFTMFQLGYGSAVAIIMLLISLVFSIGYLRIVRQPEYLGAQ